MKAHPGALEAMLQKSLAEVPDDLLSLQDSRPLIISEPKLQNMGLDTSKKAGQSNGETLIASSSPPHSFEDEGHRKLVGETTAETMSLLSASVENYNPDLAQIDLLRSELVGIKPMPAASSFQYHVLAVDDSRTDQRVIEKLLKTSSYKVTTVSSALKALEVLGLSDNRPSSIKKIDISLIMTDYCMPEMTGYDLLKRVKAETSALKDIPVVVMSSENDSARIKRCLAEGAEEFLIKPVRMADVKRMRDHIRPPSTTSSSGTSDSSGSTSGKRKAEPRETLEVTSSERRPRLGEEFVS